MTSLFHIAPFLTGTQELSVLFAMENHLGNFQTFCCSGCISTYSDLIGLGRDLAFELRSSPRCFQYAATVENLCFLSPSLAHSHKHIFDLAGPRSNDWSCVLSLPTEMRLGGNKLGSVCSSKDPLRLFLGDFSLYFSIDRSSDMLGFLQCIFWEVKKNLKSIVFSSQKWNTFGSNGSSES